MRGKLHGKRVSYDFATDTYTVDTRGINADDLRGAAMIVSDRTGIPVYYVQRTDKATGDCVGFDEISAVGEPGKYALSLVILVVFGELAATGVPYLRSVQAQDAGARETDDGEQYQQLSGEQAAGPHPGDGGL